MPRSLAPLVQGAAITDRVGQITDFFRFRWQELVDAYSRVPSVALIRLTAQTAAIPTARAHTTTSAGLYRVSWYLRKTVADGVSSSVTVTIGWVESSISLTLSGSAVTTDAVTAMQSGTLEIEADNASDITYATAYASNTANQMGYRLTVTVERIQ